MIRAASDLGLRVPEDLSIVGYDDAPLLEWITPPLTTVKQPLAEMATLATQMLLTLARGEQLSSQRVELGTELIIRKTTAPPPSQ